MNSELLHETDGFVVPPLPSLSESLALVPALTEPREAVVADLVALKMHPLKVGSASEEGKRDPLFNKSMRK